MNRAAVWGIGLAIVLVICHQAKAEVLKPGESLSAGQSRTSDDGRFTLTMQRDGNLVWRYGERILWAANPGVSESPECVMQRDGNLVIYGTRAGQRRAVWDTGTWKFPGSYLALQSDSNMVLYYRGQPVLVGFRGYSPIKVAPPPGGQIAVWDLKKPLVPARAENTIAVSIHQVHCEAITANEGCLFGEPADELYFLVKEGNTQRRIGKEGDRDIVEFKRNTRKWLNEDLTHLSLKEGEKRTFTVHVMEQEGKIRINSFFVTFSNSKGVEGASLDMDLAPRDDRVGTFHITVQNDKGEIKASCQPGEKASFHDGIVTCTGAGAKYNIFLIVDHYSQKKIVPISLK